MKTLRYGAVIVSRFVCGTLWPNTYDDIQEAVVSALRSASQDVVALPYGEKWPVDRIPIVLGAHNFGTGTLYDRTVAPPAGAILYDLEQPSEEYIAAIAKAYRMLGARLVWSWSEWMTRELRLRGVSVQHVPFGCVPEMRRPRVLVMKEDIDVFFYGHLTPRRQFIIDACKKAGLRVESSGDCWGVEKDSLVQRSKIVLNLRKSPGVGEIEAVRLAYLIANGKCVVSEIAAGADRFNGVVEFADIEDIPQRCVEFLRSGEWEVVGAKALAMSKSEKLKFTIPGVNMHDSVMSWLSKKTMELSLRSSAPVLEVGSYNVNGSAREFFERQEDYVGVDVAAGPGVDQVVSPVALPFKEGGFAVVVSTEMLEHAAFPALTLVEMRRVLQPGGVLLLTTRSEGFPHHNPPDYHRYSPGQMRDMLKWLGFERVAVEVDSDPRHPGVFVVAYKPAEGWVPEQYAPSDSVSGDSDEDGIVGVYLKAYEKYQRGSYLQQAASFCNTRKKHVMAFALASAACALDDAGWEAWWELALAAHYTGRFGQAIIVWNRVLEDVNLPEAQKEIAKTNWKFSRAAYRPRPPIEVKDYPLLPRRGGPRPLGDGEGGVENLNEVTRTAAMPEDRPTSDRPLEGPGEDEEELP